MNRLIKMACFIFMLLAITFVSLPIRSSHIMASETDLKKVTVIDNEKSRKYKTGAQKVEDFFKEQNIELKDKDLCEQELTDVITEDMSITIWRSIPVVITVDGVQDNRHVTKGTTVARLKTVLQDEWNSALLYKGDEERELTDNNRLEFLTWQSKHYTETVYIPYETIENETTAVHMGQRQERQAGVFGQREITKTIIYIGGEEVRSEVVEDIIIKEPVNSIVDIGIGGQLGTLTNTSAPEFQYIQKLTMNASAYTAGYESTGKNPGDPGYGITRTGVAVKPGIVSVDPRVIPLGTRLYVEGYGYSLAADTGSSIVGHMIDLFYESLEDALKFGRRNIAVYILGD